MIIQEGGEVFHSYVPRSDFCIVTRDVPVLLLEVNSEGNEADKNRMLLQGACIVRLVNLLIKPGSRFALKALYIDEHYDLHEHTMYQLENELLEVVFPLITE